VPCGWLAHKGQPAAKDAVSADVQRLVGPRPGFRAWRKPGQAGVSQNMPAERKAWLCVRAEPGRPRQQGRACRLFCDSHRRKRAGNGWLLYVWPAPGQVGQPAKVGNHRMHRGRGPWLAKRKNGRPTTPALCDTVGQLPVAGCKL